MSSGLTLRTTFIVGFPGETDAEFAELRDVLAAFAGEEDRARSHEQVEGARDGPARPRDVVPAGRGREHVPELVAEPEVGERHPGEPPARPRERLRLQLAFRLVHEPRGAQHRGEGHRCGLLLPARGFLLQVLVRIFHQHGTTECSCLLTTKICTTYIRE